MPNLESSCLNFGLPHYLGCRVQQCVQTLSPIYRRSTVTRTRPGRERDKQWLLLSYQKARCRGWGEGAHSPSARQQPIGGLFPLDRTFTMLVFQLQSSPFSSRGTPELLIKPSLNIFEGSPVPCRGCSQPSPLCGHEGPKSVARLAQPCKEIWQPQSVPCLLSVT